MWSGGPRSGAEPKRETTTCGKRVSSYLISPSRSQSSLLRKGAAAASQPVSESALLHVSCEALSEALVKGLHGVNGRVRAPCPSSDVLTVSTTSIGIALEHLDLLRYFSVARRDPRVLNQNQDSRSIVK